MKKTFLLLFKLRYLFFALLFALGAGLALLHPGLPPTHDGEYHLIRFFEFDKMLRAGNWYPRWAPDLDFGYGVPLFTYVYPLPNYVASFFHLFGASFLDSVRLNMFAATLIGGLFFYLWAKEFWGNKGGLVSSVFYSFAPYHFVDIYVRGSVGEVWALGLFPMFLYFYTLFSKNRQTRFLILSSISLALIIFSHNILALMFFPFAVSYMLFLIIQSTGKKYVLLTTGYILLLSLSLSCIFWLPALTETKYVTGLQLFFVKDNFPDLFQLLFPSWGTGFSQSDLTNQMSFQIGTANLIAVTISIGIFFLFLRRKQKEWRVAAFFLVWFVVIFYSLLEISLPLWTHVPLMNYFQFPWRLLSLMILLCSFLAGSIVFAKKSWILTIILLLLAVGTTYDYAHPAYYLLRSDSYYTKASNFIDGTNSPGNLFHTIFSPTHRERAMQKLVMQQGKGSIEKVRILPEDYTAQIHASSPLWLDINSTYFLGWSAAIDNQPVLLSNDSGDMKVPIPKGIHQLHVFLSQTLMQKVSSIISCFACIIVLVSLLFATKQIVRKLHSAL